MKLGIFAIAVLAVLSGCVNTQKASRLSEDELRFTRFASSSKKTIYREEMVRRHPEWTEDVKQNVLNGKIDLGMSKSQVLSSLGKPIEAMGGEDSSGKSFAFWIYSKSYLIFENDKLQSINEKKRQENRDALGMEASAGR
jgi:hypothetical protein